jgi:hypothetical protein
LTYGKVLVGVFERREDFSCHPKIRMLHIEEQDLVCQRLAVGAVLGCQGTPFGGEDRKGYRCAKGREAKKGLDKWAVFLVCSE